MQNKKNIIFTISAALLLAVVAFMFFFPDAMEGRVLQQHDIQQGLANGHEGQVFKAETGESTRWTNSLFGGMPTFQISPSYPANDLLSWIQSVYMLGLPSPANLLFGMMLGFFIMCLCMKMRWSVALFASLAWGFSSYFIIIIGAGHIWKFLTLCYIPPTIGGLILIYRKKWLAGGALTALFSAMQLMSNHPQMTYYFLIVMACIALAYLWIAIKDKSVGKWAISTCVAIVCGLIGVAANSPSLYNSLEYSKETVRGRATDITDPNAPAAAGMDKDAITAWSYGIDETWSLLIPNVKGGASLKPTAGQNRMLSVAETDLGADRYLSPEEMQFAGQFTQYFGDQPMTNGPVYVGAFVLLLAILAMFVVEGKWETPMKWALFAATIITIMLSWGHNFNALTDFMIDNFPGYNKFRTVSSILVVAEFCIPLLAALCIRRIITTDNFFGKNKWTVICVMGGGAAICLIGWIAPSVFGEPYSASELGYLKEAGVFTNPAYANVMHGISNGRLGLVSTDSMRSLIFIVIGCALLFLWEKKIIKNASVWACCLAAMVLVDLYTVDKRYVDSDNFVTAANDEEAFVATEADLAILQDKSNYRVMDIPGFSSARSSYFHKTIGGYHAAKLTRYNDLIEHQITKGNPFVINMLNAKYFLTDGGYSVNPDAFGNAWFVDTLTYVGSSREEMEALSNLEHRNTAVADKKFADIIGTPLPIAKGDTIYETSYAPNKLTYKAHSAKGGVALFSEVYFPWGWKATVNGKETPIGQADYVLRALRLPAGDSEIVMEFNPESVNKANNVAMASVILIYLLALGALAKWIYGLLKGKSEEREVNPQ
ncbi:MAG: YfhO family protein [Muribaculaceae bacterium]|nr:YfhO family protein [Muribaculaceae bacterium]